MKSAEGRRPSALNRAYSSVPELYDTLTPPAMLRRRILAWYRRSGRDLPWRRTRDPYRVLVSEVMLQQTQVSRAQPAYRRFLRRFPTLRALARASLGDVLREWSGLGYNRRARDLHGIARLHPVRLPRTIADLDALPGVGAYTASAVACFALGQTAAFADTNIRRVLGRALLGHTATDREAVELDARFGSRRMSARWHHALMDIGATICTAKRPRCDVCPVRAICSYRGIEKRSPRKQSPFGVSDRRVRGAIVRHLATSTRRVTLDSLRTSINDARVPRLVLVLAQEGLVEVSSETIRLPSR
jgi:A/G-specific adenine glycosylase